MSISPDGGRRVGQHGCWFAYLTAGRIEGMDDRELSKQKMTCILPATVVCWLVWAVAPSAAMSAVAPLTPNPSPAVGRGEFGDAMGQAPNDGKGAGAIDYLKQVKPLLRER